MREGAGVGRRGGRGANKGRGSGDVRQDWIWRTERLTETKRVRRRVIQA